MAASTGKPTPRRARPPGRWRRRLFYGLLIGVTVYVFCVHPGRRAMLQVELLMAERALAASADPPGSLVFDGEESLAKERVLSGQWQADGLDYWLDGEQEFRYAARVDVTAKLQRLVDASRAIDDWSDLRTMPVGGGGGGLFGGGGGGGLFSSGTTSAPSSILTTRADDYHVSIEIAAHTRTAASRPERIVRVLAELSYDSDRSVAIQGEVWERLSLFDTWPVLLTSSIATIPAPGGKLRELVLLPDDPKKGVRLYAVQPDPADACRFFFDYEVNGDRGTIEGKLQADDTIQWQVLSGPAADPTWHADKLHPVPGE